MPEKTLIEAAGVIIPIVAGSVAAAGMQAREPSKKTRLEKSLDFVIDSVIGCSFAYFLAPFATDYLGKDTENARFAVGFLFGALGVQIMRWAIKNVPAWLSKKTGVE